MAVPTTSPVPTLDAIASSPETAASLPRATVLALHARAVRALAALEAPLLAAANGAAPEPEDRLLDVEEAAARLGVASDWLYRRSKKLPFVVRVGSLLRFSSRGLDRWIQARRG